MTKRNWILVGTALPVLGFIALLAWASVKSGGNPGGLVVNANFGEVRIDQKPAKNFTLNLMNGEKLTLEDLEGKLVLMNFWASWCPPCRQEAPALVRVYQEYQGLPVEFVGVDIWDREEDALEFLDTYGVTYPNGIDQRGAIAIDYGVRGIPETFFIGPDGTLLKKFVGPMNEERLRALLDQLLAETDVLSYNESGNR